MDSLFQSLFPAPGDGASSPAWAPRADVVETSDAFLVAVDLPGVDQESLELTLDEGVLKVNGERTLVPEHRDGRFHLVERSYGRFARSFRLGFASDVDTDSVEAQFENGVLAVSVRKAEAAKPRRIEVRTSVQGQISSGTSSTGDRSSEVATAEPLESA
ncbi:MAG TPA: Hsp20/alpha crystallin family protein [Rubricoccaceae bacterium]